jgi:High-temperature-induced dauer-formation protein
LVAIPLLEPQKFSKQTELKLFVFFSLCCQAQYIHLEVLCYTLLSDIDQLLRRPSTFASYLVSSDDKKLVLSFLCSLLNSAMKYNPAGWHLPYEHYVISDPKKLLITYALQTLLVLLTCDSQSENGSQINQNIYRFYLGKLHRTDDFQFVVDGINRLLNLPIQSNASVLPGSQRVTKTHSEAMVLFWEVWKTNKVH